MRHFLLLVVVGITVYPLWGHPLAQEEESNQIIFQNQSGQSALVKLIGPSSHVVSVPNGESRSVAVDSGEYYFITQYGNSPNQYSYRRSDKFTVNAAPGQVARVSITLHTVPGGNFSTRGSSSAEFNAAAGQESQGGVRQTNSTPASPRAPSEADTAYWKEVDKTNPEELESYLKKYPDGEFAELARARLKKLNAGQAGVSTGPPTPPVQGDRPRSATTRAVPEAEKHSGNAQPIKAGENELAGTWGVTGYAIQRRISKGKVESERRHDSVPTQVPFTRLDDSHYQSSSFAYWGDCTGNVTKTGPTTYIIDPCEMPNLGKSTNSVSGTIMIEGGTIHIDWTYSSKFPGDEFQVGWTDDIETFWDGHRIRR